MNKSNIVVCPSCGQDTHIDDMTDYNGKSLCEGCAENTANFDPADDPHGKGWTDDNAYQSY